MKRWRQVLRVIRFRGIGYLGYLLAGHLLPRFCAWLLFASPVAEVCRRIVRRAWRTPVPPDAPRSTETGGGGDTVSPPLEFPQGDTVLGRIDNDGRLLPTGKHEVAGFDPVDAGSFDERYRYDLDLVSEGGDLLIRKDYRGDRAAFLREWQSLRALEGHAFCPSVRHVDPRRLLLYKSFIPGRTLRQHLVEAGARILSVDTDSDLELVGLKPQQRIEAVWERGRQYLNTLGPGFPDRLETQLDALHGRGVTGFSLSFGNVVLHEANAEPCFIDFDAARAHPRAAGFAFAVDRDHDRRLFGRIYGRDLLDEKGAWALARELATPYSPFDLGGGLASRGFWSADSGTGRWEVLNKKILGPLVHGGRILDLGSYNALLPLLMLRAGARQVVAVERSPDLVEIGWGLRRLFEWRDLKRYDLELRRADMRAMLTDDWGHFDVVTAFCSLYYLDVDEMKRMVRRAAEIAPVLVLQAKVDTRPHAADNKAEKSSLSFLRSLLEQQGFLRIEVVAPAGFPRPLLIGYRLEADP